MLVIVVGDSVVVVDVITAVVASLGFTSDSTVVALVDSVGSVVVVKNESKIDRVVDLTAWGLALGAADVVGLDV